MTRWNSVLCLAALAVGCNKDSSASAAVTEPEPKAEAPAEQTADPSAAPEDVAKAPADAQRGEGGLAWKVLEPPTGTDSPAGFDRVEMDYILWSSADGRVLDRSRSGRSTNVMLHQARPGWGELLSKMKVGEKRRAWLPASLAGSPRPGVPGRDLTLDVKLVRVEKLPPPPPVPADVAAAPADASKSASGLATKVLTPGKGKAKPAEADQVSVHYTGWTTDGKMFDSSLAKGEPISFGVKQVIPGWSEGVQLMVEGEKRRMWIPEELAYRGSPGAPAGMLVFDVELVKIVKAPEAPKTPKDVAAAPKRAKKTASGLASVVLSKGTGTAHPAPTSEVEVHYSGWTTDGKMFDSSVTRGTPLKFRLNGVIAGWTEGLQLMVVGEKRRLWIPEELAYKGRPGAPQGMLVFDVELLGIGD